MLVGYTTLDTASIVGLTEISDVIFVLYAPPVIPTKCFCPEAWIVINVKYL